MESFSLLKYWRAAVAAANMRATTTTSVLRPSAEMDDDEGPFFDLEFTLPVEDIDGELENAAVSFDDAVERGLKLAVSQDGSHLSHPCLSLSPSEKPLFPLLLNSATKLRVFILGLKKPKSAASDPAGSEAGSPRQQQNKFFIRFKIEEVPVVSLFTRYNSSRHTGRASKLHAEYAAVAAVAEEEKRFSMEMLQKYINRIKPLYVKVSRRYGEKLRFSGLLNFDGVVGKVPNRDLREMAVSSCGVKNQRPLVPAGLRGACKRLGNSRSASPAAASAPPPTARRRDDSLLQQLDGIQSAIAHCKRSFNADGGVLYLGSGHRP